MLPWLKMYSAKIAAGIGHCVRGRWRASTQGQNVFGGQTSTHLWAVVSSGKPRRAVLTIKMSLGSCVEKLPRRSERVLGRAKQCLGQLKLKVACTGTCYAQPHEVIREAVSYTMCHSHHASSSHSIFKMLNTNTTSPRIYPSITRGLALPNAMAPSQRCIHELIHLQTRLSTVSMHSQSTVSAPAYLEHLNSTSSPTRGHFQSTQNLLR